MRTGRSTAHHVDGDLLVQSEFTNGGGDRRHPGLQVGRAARGGRGRLSERERVRRRILGTNGRLRNRQLDHDHDAVERDPCVAVLLRGRPQFERALQRSRGSRCHASRPFLTNTRTSQSPNADLKDFAFGGLNTCGRITIKRCSAERRAEFLLHCGQRAVAGELLADGQRRRRCGDPDVRQAAARDLHDHRDEHPAAWSLNGVYCTTSGPGTSVSGPTNGAITVTVGLAGNVTVPT